MGSHAGGMSTTHSVAKPVMCMSRFSTDESAEDLPHQKFSQKQYMLMSRQFGLPEWWLGVPPRQIPPEYEYTAANFNPSAYPKSLRWRNNYRSVRRRPGLWELSAEDFWAEGKKVERLPACRKYLAERRRRPAPAAMRAHMATLVVLPDGGVASAVVAAEVNAEAVQVSRNAPPALHSTATDQEEIAVVGERTFAQRDAECRKRTIDLNNETPRKQGRAAAGALEERVVGARSVCTAAVAKRARELALSAFDEYMADRIDAAEFDRRKAEARAKATAEHATLTELERASAEYMEAVSARTKAEAALSTSEAAEDAAEALAAAKFADKFRRSSRIL